VSSFAAAAVTGDVEASSIADVHSITILCMICLLMS
jgi:hypothetical protein